MATVIALNASPANVVAEAANALGVRSTIRLVEDIEIAPEFFSDL